jgi:phosphate transport system permease protein
MKLDPIASRAFPTFPGRKASVSTAFRWRRRLDQLAEWGIFAVAFVAIAMIFLIFAYIAREALPLITGSTEGLSILSPFKPPIAWQPVQTTGMAKYNVLPLVLGTLKVTLISLLFATPLALAAALYTSEFAPKALREWIKPAIEILAGIPSVVMGFFVLIVLASWLQTTLGFAYRLNALTAGIGLALAIIPVIYTVTEDAMNAVPRHYREASLALGASATQTAFRVVLPTAMPGIGAAIILGFGRAIGETMIVLMASGNAAILSLNPADPTRTLSATVAAELAEVVFGSGHYRVLFFIGTLLFLITSGLNWAGDRFRRHLRIKLFGSA